MAQRLNSESLEYIYVEVLKRSVSGTSLPLTTLDVDLAFKAHGDPESGDWYVAEWVPDNEAHGRNVARILVGPDGPVGTPTLPEGKYYAFARIHEEPELPVIKTNEQVRVT